MNTYVFLALYLVLSVILIVLLVHIKIYFFFMVEEMRKKENKMSFFKTFWRASNIGIENTIIYLFTLPEENYDDDIYTKNYIKKHFWVTCILIFLILFDFIIMLF
ncbi:putative membrane protein [Arcicella rosea]